MRHLYAPAFFFGFIGLALYLVGEGVSLLCLPALLPLAILLRTASAGSNSASATTPRPCGC